MFPASDVSHIANKTHTEQSIQADEDSNSEERGNADVTTQENDERQYYNSREVSDFAKAVK